MSGLVLNPSPRLRRSPLFERLRARGARAWSVYNRTLIGQWYGGLAEDYEHLKSAVQIWDVGGQRVVEVRGPDAARLIQLTTPREVAAIGPGRCAYLPMVLPDGGMLNDPVLTRLGPDRFWLAMADGDAGLYLRGLAAGRGLSAEILEPDIWILAVQGPLADGLIGAVLGPEAVATGFFCHVPVMLDEAQIVLARSGWSKQGGFELHVPGAHVVPVWERLMEAGRPLDVRPGCPNLIERIEGGLLSYGADMTRAHTPFEAGLGRFCETARDVGCLAWPALAAANPPRRQIRPLEIAGGAVPTVASAWALQAPDGAAAGRVTSAAWSPALGLNVAIAMIGREHWTPGTKLLVDLPDGTREARVAKRFWGRK